MDASRSTCWRHSGWMFVEKRILEKHERTAAFRSATWTAAGLGEAMDPKEEQRKRRTTKEKSIEDWERSRRPAAITVRWRIRNWIPVLQNGRSSAWRLRMRFQNGRLE
ncbi:hypothetical protein L596_024221 [Steinernema carpocapsae]|uniref:Uncharacterized protein n=1 Tax=Steinernema carpocapsae TaxID=34508 RepID=A0A4U5MG41_STECR|nr:hypothetical protein L596_024221 [Steinernema carpocapsae]